MFTKKLRDALTEEVFERSESAGFHDAVFEATENSFGEIKLMKIFKGKLSEHVQILALENGLNDTEFRERACNELRKNWDGCI